MKNSPVFQWFLAFVLTIINLIIRFTCRIEYIHKEYRDETLKVNDQAIFTLWHGRLFMMPLLFPRKIRVYALISAHADGRIIKNTAAFQGIKTITGSSSKGGAAALREMVSKFKTGHSLFITPDGPKGPRMQAQLGAVEVARLTGGAIIPCAISAQKGKIVNSWDKFLIPRPFSTIYIRFGEPIHVINKEEREEKRLELEAAMVRLQHELDRKTTLTSIETSGGLK